MKNTIRTLIHLAALIVFGAVFGSFTSLAQPIPGQYIAVLKGDVPNPANAAQELAGQHGVNVRHIYEHSIHGFAFEGNEKAAQALAHNPRIAYVEQDQLCQAWADPEIPSGLARIGIDQTILGQISPGRQNVNVRIAIIDTGIAPHPDLNIDANGVRFFVRGSKVVSDSNSIDDNGHGTHVAGTAAANGQIVGVAPGALVTGIKVLDATGSGPTSVVIAGINYVAQNAAKFDVANMSLGGGFSQALNDAVTAATQVGVVFCVAAGNSGKDVQNYSPASTPSAITVSALTDLDAAPGGAAPNLSDCLQDDAIACWSNFGSGVDICAPGVQIKSTWLNAGYNTISGTSMATPHVTGAAALYIARNRQAVAALPASQRVAYVTQALTSSGWILNDYGYFDGAGSDGFAEPLLNARSLLGFSTRPQIAVTINSPATGATFDLGQEITFDAFGSSSDLNSPLFWDWSSSIDGLIGTTPSFSTSTLSQGTHNIVASYTQSDSWFIGADAITIIVGNPNPPPPPPIQLVLAVSTDKPVYKVGEVVQTYYRVTAQTDASPVPGATVDGTLTDAKGNRYSLHALTDANGLVAAGFQTSASSTGRGTYSISGTATKTGYLAAQGSTTFQVK
jgi:subtilisin